MSCRENTNQKRLSALYDPTFCLQVVGLYKGMTSPLYGLAAINAIVFGVQGNVLRRMADSNSLVSHGIAGGVAGFAQCIICSPMELAKTRMQIQGRGESRRAYHSRSHEADYKGPVNCLKRIYRYEGIRGVYRGFLLTVARETPGFSAYFMSYEYLCRLFAKEEFVSEADKELGVFTLLFAGGVAGMCAWLVSYPIDVIKSKIQADKTNVYKNVTDCVRKTYQEGGVSAFGTGLCSTLLRAFPVNAATFATVAWVLRALKAEDDDDGSYTFSLYVQHHHPPMAAHHLASQVSNFPSSP